MNRHNLIQIAYLSFATFAVKADPAHEINQILSEAEAHNTSVGITGELIYRNGIFLQLLEGPKEDVELILGRILLDHKRHENLKVLFKQPMHERVFPDWSMAYVNLDNSSLDLVNTIVPWQNLINAADTGSISPHDMLKIFKQMRA